MKFVYKAAHSVQHEKAKIVTFLETTPPKQCTLLSMLSAEEITDLQVFHGRNPKKVVAVNRLNWRISIGKVLHGHYFLKKGIKLDNGDYISQDRNPGSANMKSWKSGWLMIRFP